MAKEIDGVLYYTKEEQSAAIKKRVDRMKTDEATQAKLEELDALKAEKATREEELLAKQAQKLTEEAVATAEKQITDMKLDVSSVKELRAYDNIIAEKDEEKRADLIKELASKKPNLIKDEKSLFNFKPQKKDIFGNMKKENDEDKVKIY